MFSHQKVALVKRIRRIRGCGFVGVGVVLLKDMCHLGWALIFEKVQIRSSIFFSLSLFQSVDQGVAVHQCRVCYNDL